LDDEYFTSWQPYPERRDYWSGIDHLRGDGDTNGCIYGDVLADRADAGMDGAVMEMMNDPELKIACDRARFTRGPPADYVLMAC